MVPASFALMKIGRPPPPKRSEEHTSELQSQSNLVCRLLLEKKNKAYTTAIQLTIFGARMEPQKIKNIFRPCGLLMISIGCTITFAVPAAGQAMIDPANVNMQ